VLPVKAWQIMCLIPRPGCWISSPKNIRLRVGRWVQLFMSGGRRVLSHGSFVVCVPCGRIGSVEEGDWDLLSKLPWCSSDVTWVLRLLARILVLQITQMCQWVLQLRQEIFTMGEPGIGGWYVPLMLQSKHWK
jgi:hypothetical protein